MPMPRPRPASAFAVNDGLAGFPAAYFDGVRDGVEMKVVEGSLHIRSPGTASRYVTAQSGPLLDADRFVDTGDMVERRGDRYFFAGRKGGIINIGGLKVHPEEVEAVINRHPLVRMSLVRSRAKPDHRRHRRRRSRVEVRRPTGVAEPRCRTIS